MSGVNFINVLQAAFARADPESVQIQLNRQYIFTLLGSARVKAVCRMLMKLTPGYIIPNYQNIYQCPQKYYTSTIKMHDTLVQAYKPNHQRQIEACLN